MLISLYSSMLTSYASLFQTCWQFTNWQVKRSLNSLTCKFRSSFGSFILVSSPSQVKSSQNGRLDPDSNQPLLLESTTLLYVQCCCPASLQLYNHSMPLTFETSKATNVCIPAGMASPKFSTRGTSSWPCRSNFSPTALCGPFVYW